MKGTVQWMVMMMVAVLWCWPSVVGALEPEEALRLRQALGSFGDEPNIYEVQDAVLRHRGLEELDRESAVRRARISALLPQIQGQVSWLDQRDMRNRFRENIAADEEGLYQRDHAQHYLYDDYRLRGLYSLRLSFDLSQLVSHRQEIALDREQSQRWESRDEVIETITELYFTRRRHQLYLGLIDGMGVEERLRHHLAVDALTARINGMTGGWFREQLEGGER